MAKNDPKDPTWQYITQALNRGRTYARAQGHVPHGESCAFVSGLALGLVIWTRNGAKVWRAGDGGPTLATADPTCIELAYADHYLNMRASTALSGKLGYYRNIIRPAGYDAIKEGIFAMKDTGKAEFPPLLPNPTDPASMLPDSAKLALMLRAVFGRVVSPAGDLLARGLQENPNKPLSRPTAEGAYWAQEGNTDGLRDFDASDSDEEQKALDKYQAGHPH